MVFWCVSPKLSAQESAAIEKTQSYFKTQFARNMGVISIGYGRFFFKNRLSLDINYGYIPKMINGSRIHSFALRPQWHFKRFYTTKIIYGVYLGVSIVYSITPNTYIIYPNHFPTGYYGQNAIHFNPYIGGSLMLPVRCKKIKAISFFSEIGSTDLQIWHSINNNIIKPIDVLNLSFGLCFLL